MAGHSKRQLAAILAADVAGYSSHIERDDEGTVRALREHLAALRPIILEHGGRVIDTAGDGILASFPSAVRAVEGAIAMQKAILALNRSVQVGRRLQFRIGVNLGDVICEGSRLYGDGVNIAARLEALAEPGGVCISSKVYQEVQRKLAMAFEDFGEHHVKSISEPIRAYRILADFDGADGARERQTHGPAAKPSIAVLPFLNLSEDQEDYFSDGITEDIITALSKLRGFFVIARNSTFAYKGKSPDIRRVARDLGVRYVLEGSVRRAGSRLRVAGQLIDALSGNHVWAERYDRTVSDVFDVQDEVTASVVVAIEPQLYAAESARLQQKQPSDLDAWDCLMRALPHMWRLTRADNAIALGLFSAAIRLDPGYARALGLHSWLSLYNAHMGWSKMRDVHASAVEQAQAAVALDREDPWAHLASGTAAMFARKHEEAVEEIQAALDLNPNFALAYSLLGLALAYGGKGAEGIEPLARALQLSPRDPFFPQMASARAFAHFMAGDSAAGVEWGRRSVRHSTEVSGYWRALALSAAALGYEDEARAALAAARRLQPEFSVAWVERDSPLVHADDRRRYCELLRRIGLPEV